MESNMHTYRVSYLYLANAMFIAGSAVVVSKIMVGSLPMFLATELGIIVGMMCLIPLVFFIKKEAIQTDLKTNAILLLQALFGVFFYRIFTFWGLQYTTAANSGLITSSSPVIVALLAFFFLKERLSRQRILGIFFVVIGLFIINLYPFFNGETDGSTSIKGNVLILLAVFCEALFSIMSKVACKPVSALYRTAIITFYAFLLLLPFSIYDGLYYDWTRINSSSIFCVFYYGVFVSFLSYVLWFKGIERVQASSSAVFTSIVPVSSIILSALILNDSILFVHIIGLICIISGIFVSAYTHAPT
ncbi:DMT family transporter [Lacrimispora sp.]|jgi:drug/metabolite transporter (DMT)-like permease|uniref:DMT family transporter n=1 Tax=Lacrimispora sp. TaxID=2719234 RepID=UPI00289A4986|nr:DMT family transporter [Lacrimispora sp.]